MIAEALHSGLKAMCLNPQSPNKMDMTTESTTCQHWKDAPFGAIDDPGSHGAYEWREGPDETIP